MVLIGYVCGPMSINAMPYTMVCSCAAQGPSMPLHAIDQSVLMCGPRGPPYHSIYQNVLMCGPRGLNTMI